MGGHILAFPTEFTPPQAGKNGHNLVDDAHVKSVGTSNDRAKLQRRRPIHAQIRFQ
jgi:hypothetical protein